MALIEKGSPYIAPYSSILAVSATGATREVLPNTVALERHNTLERVGPSLFLLSFIADAGSGTYDLYGQYFCEP